jgi:hypothetical protein
MSSFKEIQCNKHYQDSITDNRVSGASHSPEQGAAGFSSMHSSDFDDFLAVLDFQSGIFSGTGFESLGKVEYESGRLTVGFESWLSGQLGSSLVSGKGFCDKEDGF